MLFIERLAALYKEEELFFKDLLLLLEKEGEILKGNNLSSLYPLFEEKKDLGEKIELIQKARLKLMEKEGRIGKTSEALKKEDILARFSPDERAFVEEDILRLDSLKKRVKSAADNNLSFLKLGLELVEDLISVFMQNTKKTGTYSNQRPSAGLKSAYVNRRA